jgi:hypothetical protein
LLNQGGGGQCGRGGDIGAIILIRIYSFNNSSFIMVGVEEVDSVCISDGDEVEIMV